LSVPSKEQYLHCLKWVIHPGRVRRRGWMTHFRQ